MKRVLALLVCVPALALAQTPAPQPPREQPAPERPPLKLKLDNPGSWATVSPEAEKAQPSGGLPTLGEGARPMPTTPSSSRTSPYPSEPTPDPR